MVVEDWVEFTKQALNYMGHGYELYCPILIPGSKESRVSGIDRKLIDKYDTERGKDARYRAKKAGRANYAYIRHGLNALVLRTKGEEIIPDDPDRFYDMRSRPYSFTVGSWVSIRIGPARTGKKYTAYLTKEAYRNIKAVLRENIEHRRLDVFDKYYYRLESLPAFSGILSQMGELYRFCREEIKKTKQKHTIGRLRLKRLYA